MSDDAFYNTIIEKVVPIIERFGTSYKVRSKGVYDPDTMETSEPTERTVKGVRANGFTASELGSDVGGMNRGGAFIIGHNSLLIEPSANILPTDEVEVDGQWQSCNRTEKVQPGNIVVLYVVTIGG
ncbi:hypothetical protein [Vibrio phage vB_VpS_CA8]|uniref:Uncharacterized protein n=1 Tax=Vibrio phage PH669 TaxID=2800823 RepID=A0A7T6ZMA6_9CAUD|nr:hypothetical protein [Vibrio phage vB_VpS_CA8]QEQ95122.1 hypothetical protein [Vibrio phage vB_VpS_BA3]QQK88513.1 hypothetical protein [Vibrio phage PH669]UFK26978.1 hypothetical protein [Vibrio phage vB_VpaS_AL-2]